MRPTGTGSKQGAQAPKRGSGKAGSSTGDKSGLSMSNVVAARDKIVDSVLSSFNAVLLTRKNIEEVIDDAVARGRMTRADAQEMMQSLLSRGARATSDFVSDVERLIGRPGVVGAKQPEASAGLPIVGYDELSATQVSERLAGLTPAELRKVRDYERSNANRKTVLERIERRLG